MSCAWFEGKLNIFRDGVRRKGNGVQGVNAGGVQGWMRCQVLVVYATKHTVRSEIGSHSRMVGGGIEPYGGRDGGFSKLVAPLTESHLVNLVGRGCQGPCFLPLGCWVTLWNETMRRFRAAIERVPLACWTQSPG